MRVVRAFRLPIIAAMTALGLSGCMHTSGPVASAQPQSDLDAMAYGQPSAASPRVVVAAPSNDGGGAISALRNSFASSRLVATPVGYAAAPQPVAYDSAYRLDAGDKLRVVVYGQEGLTNTYAIDAGGSITMPLIGAVPARGRTPAGLASEITAKLRNGYIRDPSVAVEIEVLSAVLYPGRGRRPRPISLRAQYERRKRGGDCRRLLATGAARHGHADP